MLRLSRPHKMLTSSDLVIVWKTTGYHTTQRLTTLSFRDCPLSISKISEDRSSRPKLVIHDPRKATFCVFAYINNLHETM